MPTKKRRRMQPDLLRGWLGSLRLHQWSKNLLVFIPIVLGGDIDEIQVWLDTFLAFLALGLVSSSTYLINDMLDAEDDRRHWSKRDRPVASGLLPVRAAKWFAAAGLLAGLALGAFVSVGVLIVLLIYIALTLAYSLWIKRVPLLDGFVLSVLFTLRLFLGTVASQVEPSPWLFVFSLFLFTSFSLAKRYTELERASGKKAAHLPGRGYRHADAPLVLGIGLAAGISAVIVMILYIIEDAFHESFEGSVLSLWGFPPVIFLLVCRVWLVSVRGEMHDDPVKFMLRDRISYTLAFVLAVCFLFAWSD
jgi:4-hydroxybenzoate polyprenyltransferase